MSQVLAPSAVEIERAELKFLESAILAMRDAGMTEDQIEEALGRRDPEPSSFRRSVS